MQLFIAASSADAPLDLGVLRAAVAKAAAPFPHLEGESVFGAVSPAGRAGVAAVAHPTSMAGPRRYRAAEDGDVVVFDGLPVAADGDFDGWDAGSLLRRWDRLPQLLEGQFAIVRARLGDERIDVLNDPLGVCPLYVTRTDSLALISNSVACLSTVTGRRSPDPLGVSTYLTLGWAGSDRTLVEGIRAVRGGRRVTLRSGEVSTTSYYASSDILRAARGKAPATADFVGRMTSLIRAAAEGGLEPVRCALTGGRDSRTVLALLRETTAATGAIYGTVGTDDDVDVRIGRLIARELGLPHQVISPDSTGIAGDARDLIATWIGLTDGMASLRSLADIGDLRDPVETIGLQLSGAGGEIGRSGTAALRSLGTNGLLVSRSGEMQRRLLRVKARTEGVARSATLDSTYEYLDAFARDRLAEGWRPTELLDTFHVYERVGRWASTGIRRSSGRDDLFSPFWSRVYLEYTASLRPGERFAESAHYRVLGALDPRLRDLPFDLPWRSQRPRVAPISATVETLREALARADLTRRLGRGETDPSPPPPPPFGVTWMWETRELHREHCLSHPESPLWAWIDRHSLETTLAAAAPPPDAGRADALLRALTLLWYFHGPDGAVGSGSMAGAT